MGYNGSGTFNLTFNWENDAANGIDITASRFDTQEGDIAANGLSICVTRDGQGVPTADIPWGAHKITGLANGTNAQDAVAYGQLTSSLGALSGFLGGLTLSTAGSSGTFGIAAGVASDSTSALSLMLTSAFTKTTSSWVAGTAAGGLDAGSIANTTWYHVFIIGSPAVAADILFSLSPTAPTLPGGYTLFRRIGSMKTDGSAHWVLFIQHGNSFVWNASVQDLLNASIPNGSVGSFTMASVPSGISVQPIVTIEASSSSGGSFNVNNGDATGVGVRGAVFGTGANFDVIISALNTNTSQQLTWFSTAGATGTVITGGWVDRRGQG